MWTLCCLRKRSGYLRDRCSRCLAQLSPQRFFPRILDSQQHLIGIDCRLIAREDTLELAVRGQLALLELRPHLARKFGVQKLGREAAERAADVVHVPLEHRERTVVGRRIHRLGSMITGPSRPTSTLNSERSPWI